MPGVLRIQERQQLTGARNAKWVVINADQATGEKFSRLFVTVRLRHMVHALGKIAACPAGHVNYPLVDAGMRQPHHLLDNLRGREIPRDVPIPHYAVNPIGTRLRLAREEAMRAATAGLKQERSISTRDCS